jgi:predicted ATP-grasp superfamily ATP-dependent carboligase
VTDDARDVAAVVLGGEITGLAVLRALGRAGVPVLATLGRDDIAQPSKFFRAAPGDPPATTDVEGVEAYFRSLPLDRAVLFPCSDSWARAISSFPPDLKERFPAVSAPLPVLEQFADKASFLEVVDRLSVPHPRTIPLQDAGDLDAIDGNPRGYFLKPHDSQSFFACFGVKGVRITDRPAAEALLDEAASEGCSLLAQEVIPGPPTNHVFLDGYVARDGRIIVLLARRRLRMFPSDFGNSTMTMSIPLSEAEEAAASLRRLFAGVGYTGLFDAEFKFDGRDDVYKVLEVNTRAWWQIGLLPGCGVDVCALAYADALGEPVEPVTTYRHGKTWVYEFADLRAWLSGKTKKNWLPVISWRNSEFAVFSRDDPQPFLRAARHRVRSLLRRSTPTRRAPHV